MSKNEFNTLMHLHDCFKNIKTGNTAIKNQFNFIHLKNEIKNEYKVKMQYTQYMYTRVQKNSDFFYFLKIII